MPMSNACPVRTSKDWKLLESQVGNDLAWTTWMAYNEDYPPTLKSISDIKKDIGIPSEINDSNKTNVFKKIRIYNAINGTSHSVKPEYVGESQRIKLMFFPNYLPVNLEKQRQREYERTAKIMKFEQAFNETYKDVSQEELDAAQIQMEDAERAGVEFENDYLFQIKSDFIDIANKLKSINKTAQGLGSNKNLEDVLKKAGLNQENRKLIVELINKNPELRSVKLHEVLQAYANSVIKNTDDVYYESIVKPANEELEKLLLEYFKPYGITTKELESLEERFGTDAYGVFDVLGKTVYYAQNRNEFTLPEEFGHVFVELLGTSLKKKESSELFRFLFDNVEKWSGYERVLKDYSKVYKRSDGTPDIGKIKKEAIGQAIGASLISNFSTKTEEDASIFSHIQKAIDYIVNLFKNFKYIDFNTEVDAIAKDILSKKYDKLDRIKKDTSNYKKLDYVETITNQNQKDGGIALKFMQYFSNIGNIITGSLAYRYQGTVYRPGIDSLHDIDMIVPQSVHNLNFDELITIKSAFGDNKLLEDILNTEYFKQISSKYPDMVFMAAYTNPKGKYLTVNSIWSPDKKISEKFNNLGSSYANRLDKFTEEERDKIYLFDFFLGDDSEVETVIDPDYNLKLAHSDYAFFEKLYTMGRDKDAFDYQMWESFNDDSGIADLRNKMMYFQVKNESSEGSKKKLKGVEKVIVDSVRRLEMRKKALEVEGKKVQSDKQQKVIDFMAVSYEQGKYLEAITSYLEHALNELENIQGDIENTLKNKYGSEQAANILKNMQLFSETHKNISTDILRELKQDTYNTDENRDAVKVLLDEARKIKEISEDLQESYIEMAKEQGAAFLEQITDRYTFEQLMKLLSEPTKDISFTETWITAMSTSSDSVLGMINKAVENQKEIGRLETLEIQQELVDLKLELESAGIPNTDFVYKHKEGSPTGFYITERDWSSVKGSFKELYKEFKDRTGIDYKKYRYDDVEVPKEHKAFVDDFNKRMNLRRKEVFLTNEEADALVEEKKKSLSKEDFNRWIKMNAVEKESISGTEVYYHIPRKIDSEYKEISDNSLKLKFYNRIVDLNIEFNDTFPPKFIDYRRAPQIRKNAVEKIMKGDIKGFATDALESFKVLEDEAERGVEYGITNERGEIINFIPIYYTKEVEEKKMLSTDAVMSMVIFANMSNDRRHTLKILHNLEVLRDVVKARGVVEETSSGKVKINAKKVLGEKFSEPFKKEDGGNILERLDNYLSMVVYGQHHAQGKSIMGVDSEKTIDALSRYTALSQLALNIYAGINNVAMGKALQRVEALSQEFFTYGDLLSADKIYAEQLVHTMGDIGRRMPTSKLGLWLLKNNTMENYSEEVSKLDTERKTLFSRLFHQSTLFFLSKAGEHYIHSKSSLALAQEFRYDPDKKKFIMRHKFMAPVKELDLERISEVNSLDVKELRKNGIDVNAEVSKINDKYKDKLKQLEESLNEKWETLTNYWDAHEIVNGRLGLKSEFSTNAMKDHLTFTNTQHAINRALNGNYGPYATAIQKYAIGRAAIMFRKWMKPAWDRRFQSNRYDELKEADTEGYYRSVGRFIAQLKIDLQKAQFSLPKAWSSLTMQDKANFKRAMYEVTYLLAVATLIGIISSLKGDDDDWLANMGAYQANRLFTELGALIPGPTMITEGLRLLENPLANVTPIRDWIQFLQFWDWGEVIERGKWKDSTKFERSLYKIVPLGKTLKDIGYPEEKLVFYNLF